MIRIIEPEQYNPLQNGDSKNSSHSQRRFQLDQESQDESDLEYQVVNTQQKGNQLVYRITNYVLLLFAGFIVLIYYIQIHHKEIIILNNIENIQISTMYYTEVEGKQTQVTLFLPNKNMRQPQQIKTNAQFCLKYHSNDCSTEILLHKKYLFVEMEHALKEYPTKYKKNVLVFWQERLALGILLLNLNKEQKVYIDVIINEEDSPIYIESFKHNLQRYQLDYYVRIMRQMDIKTDSLRLYSLVVGKNEVLDKMVYPQLLEKAVFEGTQQLANLIIYNFIYETNLLVYYHEVTNESKAILKSIANQVTAIQVNQNLQFKSSILEDFNQTFKVILLDSRKKKNYEEKQSPDQESKQNQMSQIGGAIQHLQLKQSQGKQQPILQIRRLEPSKIINFFGCSSSNRQQGKPGQFYKSEFKNLLVKKVEGQQFETHLYNFIYHYLSSVNPCNILYTINSSLLANLIAFTTVGQIYLPQNFNYNWTDIDQTLKMNHVSKNYHRIVLEPSSLETFLYQNQISLFLVTNELFQKEHERIIWALGLNTNVLLKYQEKSNLTKLLSSSSQKIFIFAIFARPSRQFDKKCIQDFDFQYFQNKTYPTPTYLLLSKTDISIQEINPRFYYSDKLERSFRYKKHQCFRKFNLISSQVEKSNLKKQQVILRVNSKTNIILQSKRGVNQAIIRIQQEEGIIIFLKNSLIISDNILIYSQTKPNIFLVLNIMSSANLGMTYFINFDQMQISNIQRHIQINDMKSTYESSNEKPRDLQMFVSNNKISVLFLSPQIFKEIHSIIPKMKKGSMILFKVEQKDYELQQIISQYLKNIKLFQIMNKKDEETTNNLCFSYSANEITYFDGLAQHSWVAIVINSLY